MNKIKEKNSFASELYRSARMGTQSLRILISKTNDDSLKEELLKQFMGYEKIENKIYNDLTSRGIVPTDVSPFQEVFANLTIQLETLFDKSSSNIATILMKGNNMGVIGITKLLNKNMENSDFLKEYAIEFIGMVENNNENLKCYL